MKQFETNEIKHITKSAKPAKPLKQLMQMEKRKSTQEQSKLKQLHLKIAKNISKQTETNTNKLKTTLKIT